MYEAVVYRADVPNPNGIIYPKAELEKAVEAFSDVCVVMDQNILAEAINPAKIAAFAKLYMSGNRVMAKLSIIDTPYGTIFRELCEESVGYVQPINSMMLEEVGDEQTRMWNKLKGHPKVMQARDVIIKGLVVTNSAYGNEGLFEVKLR